MARREDAPTKDAQDTPQAPPYYIADQPLFVDFARAFNPGDRVPAEHVEKYGWADMVHTPDAPAEPDARNEIEPETASGQATTTKEGA